MSLPEYLYKNIENLPKVKPRKPVTRKIKGFFLTSRYKRSERLNKLSDIRIMSRLRPFYIDEFNLIIPENTSMDYKGMKLFIPETVVTLHGKYVSTIRGTRTATIYQKIGDNEKSLRVVFLCKGSYYNLDLNYMVSEPTSVTTVGRIIWRGRMDQKVKTYTFGLFDSRPKPVSEYPVPEANNVELDIPYDFSVKNFIFPIPIPSGLNIHQMSVSYGSGWVPFAGTFYKDPYEENVVRVSFKITNRTGTPLIIRHLGFALSVLYEDNRHCSQINIDFTLPDRTLPVGGTTNYLKDFNLPDWAYGNLAVAWLLGFYSGSLPIYYGGPVFCFTAGRIRVP